MYETLFQLLMTQPFVDLLRKARDASLGMLATPEERAKSPGGIPIGSTPGGFHTDHTGERWYVKHHGEGDMAHAEHLANKIYRSLGHNAPHSQILYTPSKRPVYFSKEMKHFKNLDTSAHEYDQAHSGDNYGPWRGTPPKAAHKFLHGLAADSLIGNSDLHESNVGLVHGHVPTRIDNGSSLMYHGNGNRRNSKTGGRDPGYGDIGTRSIATGWGVHEAATHHSGHTVDEVVSPRFLKPHVDQIVKLRDEHGGWQHFVNRHVPGASPEFKAKATNILNYRTNKLIAHVNGTEEFN